MNSRHFTETENKVWLAGLPKKSLAVKVIIKSNSGTVLLVKPNYKPSWQFPGGGVEPSEDPKEAVIRECREELGLKLDVNALKLLDTVFRREHDNLILIYEYSNVLDDEEKLTFDDNELEGYKFENQTTAGPLLSDYYSAFWNNYVQA